MASSTLRSSRRAEGLTTRSNLAGNQNTNIHNYSNNRSMTQPNISLRKRSRSSLDHEHDGLMLKRPRISITVEQRPKSVLKKRSDIVIIAKPAPEVVTRPHPRQQHDAIRGALKHPPSRTQQSAASIARQPTEHQKKVVAGIKHELDRLQPLESDVKIQGDKRKLRSQEGSRFKSDLAQYFPDYDVVIGNEPEETHFLNVDTPIVIVDSNLSVTKPLPISPTKANTSKSPTKAAFKSFPDKLFDDLYDAQRIDFSIIDQNLPNKAGADPLPDTYYDTFHKRQERIERNIRNTEKGRAQHEKDQVIRLLEGLQGHDWLKVMGVSGITESKRKDYEPARDHFIKGCQAIVEKFRQWKEEEKRRKIAKDRALAEAAEEEEGDMSDGDPPDYSDVDHAAARQLHEEAIARSAPHSRDRKAKVVQVVQIDHGVQESQREFKSFYSKPHLREAAIGKNRRSGRTTSAWGQPIPDVPVKEFDLPDEYKDKDRIEANARKRRRERRISKE